MNYALYASRCISIFDEIKKLFSPEDILLLRNDFAESGWEEYLDWCIEYESDVMRFVSSSSSERTSFEFEDDEHRRKLLLAALNHVRRAEKVLYLLSSWFETGKDLNERQMAAYAGVISVVYEIPFEPQWFFDPPDPFDQKS